MQIKTTLGCDDIKKVLKPLEWLKEKKRKIKRETHNWPQKVVLGCEVPL